MFLPDGGAKLVCAVLTMAGVGGCVTSARCGFAFAANNSERLIGVSLSPAARALLNFIDHIFPDGYFWDDMLFTYVFPLVFIAGMTFCLLRFRESDMEVKEESTSEDRRGLYWAFIIFIAFFAIDGYMEKAWDYDYVNATLFDGVGNLIAVALFISFLTIIRKNIWHIWNLFFGFTIILAVLAYTGFAPVINIPVYILRGVYDIGWIAALYMLASAQRRFASYKLLKQCTAIFVIVSPITTLSDELTELAFPGQITTVTLFYILAIALAFLMVSPYTHKYLFNAKWIDEMNKLDMTLYADAYKEVERVDKENTFGLTPREMEIFTLLLSGAPFKQISATLEISDNTVRFHSKNLYRKLNIQSRTELYAKYGKAPK
jgi:DNA-binding CsgD family transcriptional regulator